MYRVLCCALERLDVIFLFLFMIWNIDCLSLDSFESSTRLVGGGWSGLSNVYVGSWLFLFVGVVVLGESPMSASHFS